MQKTRTNIITIDKARVAVHKDNRQKTVHLLLQVVESSSFCHARAEEVLSTGGIIA